jgi:hypothetical protein
MKIGTLFDVITPYYQECFSMQKKHGIITKACLIQPIYLEKNQMAIIRSSKPEMYHESWKHYVIYEMHISPPI